MMFLQRIVQLRGHGVFRDFSWPSDLTEFGRYNLIYGWNGSGKTTLSRLLRDLELRRQPSMGEARLRINGIDVHGPAFPESSLPIRVFNRDFVYESVFPVGGGDVPPIFVVGKESVEKQKQADGLREQRRKKEEEQQKATKRKSEAEGAFDAHCINRALIIKTTLRSSDETAYNNYNKASYQGRAQQMADEGNASSFRLDDAKRKSLLAQHWATPKPTISEVSYTFPDLQALTDEVSTLLRMTVSSAAIQALKDDAPLATWVRDGLGLHKDRNSDKCLFCEQPLPEDRLADLQAHFNTEYERFLSALHAEMDRLETVRKQADDLRPPDRAAFYDYLAADYDAAKESVQQGVNTVRPFIEVLIKALAKKKAQPFQASSLTVTMPSVDTDAVDRVNKVIRQHNAACEDFSRQVGNARDCLAYDMIAETLDEFARLRDGVQEPNRVIEAIRTKIYEFNTEITQIEREIREHQQPAEELNNDLRRYLGHGDIQLTVKEAGYSITRNGTPADMLSEGEMTAIALLYFLKSLEDRGFDKRNGVVVLDDPVSSLDGNALFLAFSLIRQRTKDAGQLVLLTHDFALFRQVRNWFHKMRDQRKQDITQRPARFYMVQCTSSAGIRTASLARADPLLEEYESEYHYLFAYVYRVWSAEPSACLEDYYHVPNIARRLLEGFLGFKVPQASGELYQALKRVEFDESKKTRILRFLHVQSHGSDLVPSHDPSVLGECRAVIQDMLALMESMDGAHYSAMVQLVRASDATDECT